MTSFRKTTITIAMLAFAAFLAGCATPEEAGEDGIAGDDVFGNDTGDDGGFGDDTGDTPDWVMVNGLAYECDDTIDLDGICDEYQLNEGATGEDLEGARQVQASGDGSITVGGHVYTCEGVNNVDVGGTGTAGECETYERVDAIE